ncbi:MAG: hypothetical protein AAF754_01185 [Pseudomonadota bacterium]
MSADQWLVLGFILAVFSVPAIVSAWSDRRAPRVSAVTILIAGGMIIYALQQKPGGYVLADLPEVVIKVVSQVMN